jgi:hypothetical protein
LHLVNFFESDSHAIALISEDEHDKNLIRYGVYGLVRDDIEIAWLLIESAGVLEN